MRFSFCCWRFGVGRASPRRAPRPRPPGCPRRTASSVSTPSVGALIVCCIFIASRTRTVSPAATCAPVPRRVRRSRCRASARAASRCATTSAGSTNRGTSRRRSGAQWRRRRGAHAARSRARRRRPPRSALTRADLEDHAGRRRRETRATSPSVASGSRRGRRTTRRRAPSPVAPVARTRALRLGDDVAPGRPGRRAARVAPARSCSASTTAAASSRCASGRASRPAATHLGVRSKKSVLTSPVEEGLVAQRGDEQVAVGDHAVQPRPGQRAGEHPRGLRRGSAPRRSPWRASRRSGCETSLPDSKPESSRSPVRLSRSNSASTPGISKRVSRPLCGCQSAAGSSAYSRTSMACPYGLADRAQVQRRGPRRRRAAARRGRRRGPPR